MLLLILDFKEIKYSDFKVIKLGNKRKNGSRFKDLLLHLASSSPVLIFISEVKVALLSSGCKKENI